MMPFKKRSEMTPEEIEADIARRIASGQKRREKTAARAAGATEKVAETPPPSPSEEDDNAFNLDDLLSDAEIAAIYAEAKKKVASERKKARAAAIYDKALYEERRKEGMVGHDEAERTRLDEMTQVYIDLPRFKNQRDVPYLRIDGRAFFFGRVYNVTVAQAQSINEMMGRARLHVAQFYGESRHYFDPRHGGRASYMGGIATGGVLMGQAA